MCIGLHTVALFSFSQEVLPVVRGSVWQHKGSNNNLQQVSRHTKQATPALPGATNAVRFVGLLFF